LAFSSVPAKSLFMKKILSGCFLAMIALSAQAQKVVNDPNAEVRDLKGFHGLSVSNAFDVILTQGSEEGVVVSAADKNDNQYIRTEVDNGVLKIWFDNKNKKEWGRNRKLRAYVAVKDLDILKVSGATDITIEGQLNSKSMHVELSGASDLEGKIVITNDLKVELSGASDLNITGSANDVAIEASGASEFNAYEFTTSNCKIEASGASSVNITVEKELSAELSGASSVSYKGAGAVRHIKTSGASSVSRKS
jgi:hypothetical protein